MKICFIASVPFVFKHHLKSHIVALLDAGHTVYLVSSKDSQFSTSTPSEFEIPNTFFYGIEIPRKISIFYDLAALFMLYLFFKRHNFDIVHSITSKAGFITSIAGILTNTRYRFHTFVGQPWLFKSGLGRLIPKLCDQLIVRLNTQCYADSFSQRDLLIMELNQNAKRIKVLGHGSLSGVDVIQFSPTESFLTLKQEFGITNQLVITFIGRLTEEKGIRELIESFIILDRCYPGKLHLLLIGPFENSNQKFNVAIKEMLSGIQNISLVGYTKNPEIYLSFTDIFCLPSYREGFGTVVIEAAAMGIPAVVCRVVGLTDSVAENHTGLFCSPRNIPELVEALRVFILNSSLRLLFGENAKKRAMNFFRSDIVVKNFIDEYDSIANDNLKN